MKTFEELDKQDSVTEQELQELAYYILDNDGIDGMKSTFGNFMLFCNLIKSIPVKSGDKWYWKGFLKLFDENGYYSIHILYSRMHHFVYNVYWELKEAMGDY